MFRIGEFSKIAQVSGRLLRYYDEIGLLSPEYTDPQTGYRSYSAQQLPQLNRILVLKELGLSLEQIARLLAQDTSTEAIRGMLALRKAELEQSVQAEMARLKVVETRLQQIDHHGQMQEPDVILKSVPAQPFLSLRETLAGMDAVRRLVQKISGFVPSRVTPGSLGSLAVVIHNPVFDPEALDLEIGYLLTGKTPHTLRLSEERMLTLGALPAVETMATLVHVGPLRECHRTYGLLGQWLEQQAWQIVGTGRELLMQLPTSETTEDVVFEIQLPVSRDFRE